MQWLYWPVAAFWSFLESCGRIKKVCLLTALFDRLFSVALGILGKGVDCDAATIFRGRQDAKRENTGAAGPVKGRPKAAGRPVRYPSSSFYGAIPASRIRRYQSYLDRAFELSSTLEFHKDDQRFKGLLAEAGQKDGLCPIDLELMRMQYVFADPKERKLFRSCWAVQVINPRKEEFFPSPQAILADLFSRDQGLLRREKEPSP